MILKIIWSLLICTFAVGIITMKWKYNEYLLWFFYAQIVAMAMYLIWRK